MSFALSWISLIPLLLSAPLALATPLSDEVRIPGGSFVPLLKSNLKTTEIAVKPFFIDRYQTTRVQFKNFVQIHPEWRKGRAPGLLSDIQYLSNWKEPLSPPVPANAPATFVSWFAARAYCESHGKRLPTAAEWEYVSIASDTKRDGRSDQNYTDRILSWYANPRTELVAVGQHPNVYGAYDIHGLVWEWVEDFNGEFTSGDSRGDGSAETSEFCGAAALKVNEQTRRDYAAFMRYAFRGSLRGNYAIWNLGFRCARSER